MNACQLSEQRLQAHHDGALAPQEARAVAEHASCCARCHARLAAWRVLGDTLRVDAAHDDTSAARALRTFDAIASRLDEIDRELARGRAAPPLDLDEARRARDRGRRRASTHVGRDSRPLRLARGYRLTRAVAIAMAAGLGGLLLLRGDDPRIDIVRSLDAYGQPVMVLPEQDDATIIWMLDESDGAIGDEGVDVAP